MKTCEAYKKAIADVAIPVLRNLNWVGLQKKDDRRIVALNTGLLSIWRSLSKSQRADLLLLAKLESIETAPGPGDKWFDETWEGFDQTELVVIWALKACSDSRPRIAFN